MNDLPPKITFPMSESEQWTQLRLDQQVLYFENARQNLASDPYRPIYHFSPPKNVMNDPNGLCYWNGNYHLFYQFRPRGPKDAVHWGHALSEDAVHWQDLPIALYPDQEINCFSGQSLVEQNRVIAIYHGTGSGNSIATASDPLLLNWVKNPGNPVIPIVPLDKQGNPYRVFDPCIWKESDGYYALSGTYKDGERSVDCKAIMHLFRSQNLTGWQYLGHLVESSFMTEPGEDGAVPNFLPIGDSKYLLLFFSHKRASQYFIGSYDTDTHKFHPDTHGRMNYGPLTLGRLHAPSATIDHRGRLLSIFNVKEGTAYRGWSDIMTLPRQLSLDSQGGLSIEPLAELTNLRMSHVDCSDISIPANEETILQGMVGKSIEIEAEISPRNSTECGLYVLRSPDGMEKTRISFMRTATRFSKSDTLQIDISESSLGKDSIVTPPETGPLKLSEGENLNLRIFIDQSIVEVFANGRQCLTIRSYPEKVNSNGISFFARGSEAKLVKFRVWDMRSIWTELRHKQGI